MSKRITKELFERASAWMADHEDSSLLEETMPHEDVDAYLMDTAFDIMYTLYLLYNEDDGEYDIGGEG